MILTEKIEAKPFLRWAGGKRWLTKEIKNLLPENFNNYFEPFLGGASIYLFLKKNNLIQFHSYLSDANEDLVNTYNMVTNHPDELIKYLQKLKNTKEDYYQIRSEIPNDDLKKAARFIYLNKTSYNGIYRVNKSGLYNVPYGNRIGENLFDFDNIFNVSKIFNDNTSIIADDFEALRNTIQPNDLVFLDPPYTVAHENNGFVEYNQSIFTWEDQIRLARLLEFITETGAYFIMTNAKHDSIKELFSPYANYQTLSRNSNIGGIGATRQNINEYVFKNF